MQGQRKQETQGAESIDSYIRASSMPSRGEYNTGNKTRYDRIRQQWGVTNGVP